MTVSRFQLQLAKHALDAGEIIAYATETTLGLGCDPENELALAQLLQIKNRHQSKGLILISGTVEQLESWVDFDKLVNRQSILESWPGPETWVLPAKAHVSERITGAHSTIAVRVSSNPTVKNLCSAFGGAIVSTSANISGRPTATTMLSCRKLFQTEVGFYLHSDDAQSNLPSRIRNAVTGEVIRN